MDNTDKPNENLRQLQRQYIEKLEKSKEKYEVRLRKSLIEYANSGTENYNYFGSDILADDPVSGFPSGYFSPNSPSSFHGLGGYTAEKLIEEVNAFKSDPKNAGKNVICLDAFGQGKPGTAFADETIATTLIKSKLNIAGVKEFNGDALSDKISKEVFDYLHDRIAAGGVLRVTFFRPVVGLSYTDLNLYALHMLYERLRKVYEITDEGGLIFIRTTGISSDMQFLREILSGSGAKSILNEEDGQNRLLIKKDSSVLKALPSIQAVGDTHPDIIKALLRSTDRG